MHTPAAPEQRSVRRLKSVNGRPLTQGAFQKKSVNPHRKTHVRSQIGDWRRSICDFPFPQPSPKSHSPPDDRRRNTKPKDYNMKRIALASALVVAAVTGAYAQQAPVQLSSAIQSQISILVPGADLSNLTNAQYAQLVSLFSNAENLSAGANPAGAVKAIINAQ
jgi:hypothetical protein